MAEIELIISQLGIGGFGIYVLWRIVQELQKQTGNHMVHTNELLNDIKGTQIDICNKATINTELLKDIRDILRDKR